MALAPIYEAHRAGLGIHMFVDETRPRNQGASLTAFELGKEGVPHTVIVDNAGGHLMQHGPVGAPLLSEQVHGVQLGRSSGSFMPRA
jgi:methylthioribose-1-phosphate isomerase